MKVAESPGLTVNPCRYIGKKRTATLQLNRSVCDHEKKGKLIDYKSQDLEFILDVRKKVINITVSMPENHGLMNEFFRLCTRIAQNGYANPMALGLYGRRDPMKEVLESMAAYHYIMKFLRQLDKEQFNASLADSETACICVGDGIAPRTGYPFACVTKWRVMSIDPEMRAPWMDQKDVPNLTCYKQKMEDVKLNGFKRVIIAAVHSHANLDDLWKRIDKFQEKICLSIPCCKGFVHAVEDLKPIQSFRELQIPSEKNEVLLWHVKNEQI